MLTMAERGPQERAADAVMILIEGAEHIMIDEGGEPKDVADYLGLHDRLAAKVAEDFRREMIMRAVCTMTPTQYMDFLGQLEGM